MENKVDELELDDKVGAKKYQDIDKNKIHHGFSIFYRRRKKGWSLEKLAIKTGISKRTIQKYENTEVLKNEILMTLASALEVGVADLQKTPNQLLENDKKESIIFNTFEKDSKNILGDFGTMNETLNSTIIQDLICSHKNEIEDKNKQIAEIKEEKNTEIRELKNRIASLEQKLDEKNEELLNIYKGVDSNTKH